MKKMPEWLSTALLTAGLLIGAVALALLVPDRPVPPQDTQTTTGTENIGSADMPSDEQPPQSDAPGLQQPEFSDGIVQFPESKPEETPNAPATPNTQDNSPNVLPPVVPPEWWR